LAKIAKLSLPKQKDSREKDFDLVECNTLIDEFLLDYDELLAGIDTNLHVEITSQPKNFPSLNLIDMMVVGLAGSIASIIDMLIVKIPKDMNYFGKYVQSGSEVTSWLKSIGVDENGELNEFLSWLETKAKVPYDQSINHGGLNNFFPGNHRLLTPGHDPLFGLIFGTMDILKGRMTVIDGKGAIHFVDTFSLQQEDRMFAPLLWLAHLVSDVCTKQGIAIPGWGFTQLLQMGSFGEKERNVADITRWMYENGYDLRHFITMSAVPASIEMIVRMYHLLSAEMPLKRENFTASRKFF
jgi:hypothetical protein